MSSETFRIGASTYNITVYPAPLDGKKHPIVLLVHGNFGLLAPYGDQIQNFAKEARGAGLCDRGPAVL